MQKFVILKIKNEYKAPISKNAVMNILMLNEVAVADVVFYIPREINK